MQQEVYRAAIYLRISKEDTEKDVSDSIVNQRDLIGDYIKSQADIMPIEEFIDDGWSGVDFQRPGFSRMLQALEAGKVNCVIVKDLSRFGRNYIEAGRYLEQKFPDKNIRFIAINDGYDSLQTQQSDNLTLPFRNLINDAYCRDISIKIRSQLAVKRKNGDFISPFAAYGYVKSSEDRHRLEIDEYAANIVREIFSWKLEGMSQQRIAERLNEKGVLSPMDYKRQCGMNFKSGFRLNSSSAWSAVTVGRILKNELYIGTLIQGRRTTPNHKVKRVVEKPETEWERRKNNHDAIITPEIFQAVNGVLQQDIRVAPNQDTAYLFSGLIFCGDCSTCMVRNSVNRNRKRYTYYICGGHRTEKSCTGHRISDAKLENAVFAAFRSHVQNLMDAERMLEYVNTLPLKRDGIRRTDRLIAQKSAEIERYNRLKTKLYETLADDLIDNDEYISMKRAYDEKLIRAEDALVKLKTEYSELWENTGCHEWIERFKRHRDITELTRPVVLTSIERIDVYEGKRIEVTFKYQRNYERILEYVQTAVDDQTLEQEVV